MPNKCYLSKEASKFGLGLSSLSLKRENRTNENAHNYNTFGLFITVSNTLKLKN